MHSRDGQAISSVLGGCSEERGGRRGLCVCVFVYMYVCVCFSSASQLSKITQAEFALQKPLPRQLERAALQGSNTVHGGK